MGERVAFQIWNRQDDVTTPPNLYTELDNEFCFDYDPCPLHGLTDPAVPDGLSTNTRWGKCNFVNPPYSQIERWLDRALYEMNEHGAKSVFLIPLRVNTKYWERLVWPNVTEIRPIAGYIKFEEYKDVRGLNSPIGIVVFDPHASVVSGPSLSPDKSALYAHSGRVGRFSVISFSD